MQTHIVDALNRLCDHYGPQNWWQSPNRVEDLVATVLIQRTTERNAILAGQQLAGCYELETLATMPLAELQERIRPAGFYQSKARTIQGLAQFVQGAGGLDKLAAEETLNLRQQLLGLKGIGPETADVLLLYLFDRPVFVADEYARRLFRRMGWGDYQTYDQMWRQTQDLVLGQSIERCQEWHAVIDEHGKAYRRQLHTIDESLLA